MPSHTIRSRPLHKLLPLIAAGVLALAGSGIFVPKAHAANYNWLLAPMTTCGRSAQTRTDLSAAQQKKIMACLHNWARWKAGRAPLSQNSLLYRSSDAKTGDIFRCQQFSHTACGYYMRYRFDWVGYTTGGCWGWGENIAWSVGKYASPRGIMMAWLNSTGHRHNILDPSFRDVGFGVRKGTFLGHPDAVVWTAEFGYRC